MSKKYRVGFFFQLRWDFDDNGERKWCPSGQWPGRRFHNAKQAAAYAQRAIVRPGYKAFIHRANKMPDTITEYLIQEDDDNGTEDLPH